MGNSVGIDCAGFVRVATFFFSHSEGQLGQSWHSCSNLRVSTPSFVSEITAGEDCGCFCNTISPRESDLLRLLNRLPIWGHHITFCFCTYNICGKVIVFLLAPENIEEALEKASDLLNNRQVDLTGSWANHIVSLIKKHEEERAVCINTKQHREITALLEALEFIRKAPNVCFTVGEGIPPKYQAFPTEISERPLKPQSMKDFYPFILVNIKSGVSYHKITSPRTSFRIGGSTIGGSTFLSLLRLLAGKSINPLDSFMLAQEGDNSKVDMLVSDIYGGGYEVIGLRGDVIASSFGKFFREDLIKDDPTTKDFAHSLLRMMSFNVAQLAYLHSVVHGCNRLLLVGYYLEMPGFIGNIQQCISFWSKGTCEVLFCRMAPSLAALGANLV